jgi:hypothetical protein
VYTEDSLRYVDNLQRYDLSFLPQASSSV